MLQYVIKGFNSTVFHDNYSWLLSLLTPLAPLTDMSSFWQNLHYWLHRKLSKWQQFHFSASHRVLPRNYAHTCSSMHLLYFVVALDVLIYPYPSGLLHWHWGNCIIAPVPVIQLWRLFAHQHIEAKTKWPIFCGWHCIADASWRTWNQNSKLGIWFWECDLQNSVDNFVQLPMN